MSEKTTQPQSASAKSRETSTGCAKDTFGNRAIDDPSFPGPGANATAPSPAKPLSSQLTNSLNSRYDTDIYETAQKEKESWSENVKG